MKVFVALLVACALFAAVHTAPVSNPRLFEELQRLLDDRRYIEPEEFENSLTGDSYPPSALDLFPAAFPVGTMNDPEPIADAADDKNLFSDDYFYKTPVVPEVYGLGPQMDEEPTQADLDEKVFLELPLFKLPSPYLDLDGNELEVDKRRQRIVFQERKRDKDQLQNSESNNKNLMTPSLTTTTSTTTTTTSTPRPEPAKHLRTKGRFVGQKEIAVLRPADRKQQWNQQQQQQDSTSQDQTSQVGANSNGSDILTSELDNLKNEQPGY